MGLFKRRKKVEVDERSQIEKTFEESGQKIGRKTGELVQKGVNKFDEVKQKLEVDGTMDKIRDASSKVDEKIDEVVNIVSKKTKDVIDKVKNNNANQEN